MSRALRTVSRIAVLLFACGVYTAALVAQSSNPYEVDERATPMTFNSISGTVLDAASQVRFDKVTVDLRNVGGATVASTRTSGNGNFNFNGVGAGNYTVFVEVDGYRTAAEDVQVVNGPVFGVTIALVRTSDPKSSATGGPSIVSVRELSIPHKAHDDMEKGMELLYQKSDYAGSLKLFEKAAQEYPDYYEAYAQIGVAYLKLGDNVDAEKAFRKSIEVSHETYPDAYVGLAELFLSGHRFADAEPLARKALELDANSWKADSELARALVGLKRAAEAEASALAAVKLQPESAALYIVLANIHIDLQNNDALLDDLNRYLKLAPNGPFAEQARQERDQLQTPLSASQKPPATPLPSKP
jgi:Flp pilus assembly protein TadD